MMQKAKNSPIHKLTEKYESELVSPLDKVTDEKNFNQAELENIAQKTLVDIKKRNISEKDKVARLDYHGFFKDDNEYVWFAIMNYTISIDKDKTHRLNDPLEQKVSIFIPRQTPLIEEDKNKKVEVYASPTIKEKKVENLLSILTKNLEEARITRKYKKTDNCHRRGPHLKKTYLVSY